MMKNKTLPFYKVIHRTMKYGFKRLPGFFIVYLIVCILLAVFNFLSINILQLLFDSVSDISKNGNWSDIDNIILITGLLFFLLSVFKGLQNYINKSYFYTFMSKILKDMNAKAGRLSLIDFESVKLYDKINLAIGGVRHAVESTINLLNGVIYYAIFFISVGIYLVSVKPMLFVLCILIFIPKVISQYIKGTQLYRLQESTVECSRQSGYYQQCLIDKMYYKETKTLGAIPYFIKCYRNKVEEFNGKQWKVQVKTSKIECFLTLLTYIGHIGSFALLTYYLIEGSITLGFFAAIYYSLNKLMDIMKEMIELFGTIYEHANLAGKLYDFLELPEFKGEDASIESIGDLKLENVSFGYPYTDRKAIDNVSLTISKGSHVAIVGVNGSGKTTLVKIIMGLFKPTDGKVYINGRDTTNWSTKSFAKRISSVFQNFGKYKLRLDENVMLSDFDRKEDENYLRGKLDDAGFDYKKNGIDNHLDTVLSKEFHGIDISGGEWQRLAIARGIYREHDLIVLDEPTAAIDPIEEAFVYKQFARISEGKTVLVVTHRLGSVKSADRIIVLNEGKIIEDGSHNELIEKNGFYAKMYFEQAKCYQR